MLDFEIKEAQRKHEVLAVSQVSTDGSKIQCNVLQLAHQEIITFVQYSPNCYRPHSKGCYKVMFPRCPPVHIGVIPWYYAGPVWENGLPSQVTRGNPSSRSFLGRKRRGTSVRKGRGLGGGRAGKGGGILTK